MSILSIFLLILIIALACNSTCFHEEQSTTPMRAYKIAKNIGSWLYCVKECFLDPQCVSTSYSDEKRICHLQAPGTVAFPSCGVTPYRRWVKTEVNCQSTYAAVSSINTFYAVDFIRTNITQEMGIDPCFPDRSFLHPDLVVLDGVSPPCPLRKLDGSTGTPYTFRGLDVNGNYRTWGVSNIVQAMKYEADNTWAFIYESGYATLRGKHRFVAAYCAELGDECSCPTLPLIGGTGTRPKPNVFGACPNQKLYFDRLGSLPAIINMDGNTAMVFCSGGQWLAGDANGNTFSIIQASCNP